MLCLHAVTDESGHLLNQAGGYVNIGVQSFRRALKVRGTNILRRVQKAPDDIRWVIGKSEFDELMATKKESAPGPDGIPYSFYRGVGELGFAGFCSTHTNMCWKVVLSLRYLPKVELYLFPSPPTSTTLEGF